MRPRSHPHTPVTRGVQDALTGPDGTLPGGQKRPVVREGPRKAAPRTFPPVIARPGIGRWVCDACRDRLVTGRGWGEAETHTAQTGHRTFTALDWAGLT